jgi:hypothetical protein
MRRFCEVRRADGLNDVLNEAAGSRGDPGYLYMGKEEADLAKTKVIDEVLGQMLTACRR